MCGIFGTLSRTAISAEAFTALAERNKVRGNLGFGSVVGQRNGDCFTLDVARTTSPFDPTLVEFSNAQLALGHIRAPTGGQNSSLSAIHPFASRDGLLAHNGLLLNYEQFGDWLGGNSAEVIDSQVILGGIQTQLNTGLSVGKAIATTVAQLDGQQGCWFWHTPSQRLYLWRVMAPIFWQRSADQFTFSSIRLDGEVNLLPEGFVFELNPFTLDLFDIIEFNYYSPYGKR